MLWCKFKMDRYRGSFASVQMGQIYLVAFLMAGVCDTYGYGDYDYKCYCECSDCYTTGGDITLQGFPTDILHRDSLDNCSKFYFSGKVDCAECYWYRPTYGSLGYIICEEGPDDWCRRTCSTENCFKCVPDYGYTNPNTPVTLPVVTGPRNPRPPPNGPPNVLPSIGNTERTTENKNDMLTSSGGSSTNGIKQSTPNSGQGTQQPEGSEQSRNELTVGIKIGLGFGIGLTLVFLGFIGLLFYCRRQGRHEGISLGRKEVQDHPMTSRNDNLAVYAEIADGNTGFTAIANLNYHAEDHNEYTPLSKPHNPSSSQYKSLKKPNEDLGPSEYIDPEKYTEPPIATELNPQVKGQDEEDYVKPETETTREYFTLEPPKGLSGDYVGVDGDNVKLESEDAREYFTLEPPKVPSGDYVGVDSDNVKPNSENTREYFTLEPSEGPSSDYVSVDDANMKTESETTREYFTLEPPVPHEEPSNDYVGVDDDNIKPDSETTKKPAVSSEEPSNDYVGVDGNNTNPESDREYFTLEPPACMDGPERHATLNDYVDVPNA